MKHTLRVLVLTLTAVMSPGVLHGGDAGTKPPLTLDEFFNAVDFGAVRLSPDGRAVVIQTIRADWKANRFRNDLWLYRDAEDKPSLAPLTQSGHDEAPQWSPDGRWIAFLSDRDQPQADAESSPDAGEAAKPAAQVFVIAANGGEAFPVTSGSEEVHAFAWSADSRAIYYAIREPWTKTQNEAYEKEWKDVVRFRESERGDVIRTAQISEVLVSISAGGGEPHADVSIPPLAATPYRVQQLETSPDGRWLAFATDSRSQREEFLKAYGIYVVEVAAAKQLPQVPINLLGDTQAIFDHMAWAPDSAHIFFSFLNGSVEGPYQDAQPRVYWAPVPGGAAASAQSFTRWAKDFEGAITGFAVAPGGALLAAGRAGTEVQPYLQSSSGAKFIEQRGWPGTYEKLAGAAHSESIAFVYSSLERPAEVYLAPSIERVAEARPITEFNKLFTERALPRGKPYRWTADDGASVEGMLIYPPRKFGEKNLPMFTLIHGGPEDADGNHFEADWYQWAALAATDGWLVFEPNYRGSIGYGDAFALGIIPHIVSRPGKDILEGVDALVKDGIADPERLTIGGYSYGGYMTNWLITQTTRFRAAVSGAGAVEHVANWGNDDTTLDDAYFLAGLPWEARENYNAEAAIWQIARVRTPTHIVAGSDDIRVYVGENYLLERALQTLGVPVSLLIFPGEGHELDQNPWHGKIKVREELNWLRKYGGR